MRHKRFKSFLHYPRAKKERFLTEILLGFSGNLCLFSSGFLLVLTDVWCLLELRFLFTSYVMLCHLMLHLLYFTLLFCFVLFSLEKQHLDISKKAQTNKKQSSRKTP